MGYRWIRVLVLKHTKATPMYCFLSFWLRSSAATTIGKYTWFPIDNASIHDFLNFKIAVSFTFNPVLRWSTHHCKAGLLLDYSVQLHEKCAVVLSAFRMSYKLQCVRWIRYIFKLVVFSTYLQLAWDSHWGAPLHLSCDGFNDFFFLNKPMEFSEATKKY